MSATNAKPSTSLVIVTGYSGAGISSALKALEDAGFEVFDNIPLRLVPVLLQESGNAAKNAVKIALGLDTRARDFDALALLRLVEAQAAPLVFITCDPAVLQKRFTETRRRHPLAKDRPAADGIRQEHILLRHLKDRADLTIDTTELTVQELRRLLHGHFAPEAQSLTISLKSFGFKYGVPREADIVMDVRFLKNPHWVPELKPLTGRDPKVAAYVAADPAYAGFIDGFMALLRPLLPHYLAEGKAYLTVAIGCTGGRHRSVCVVENLAKTLEGAGHTAHADHRDMER